jgi:hypothetical protein
MAGVSGTGGTGTGCHTYAFDALGLDRGELEERFAGLHPPL